MKRKEEGREEEHTAKVAPVTSAAVNCAMLISNWSTLFATERSNVHQLLFFVKLTKRTMFKQLWS